MPESVPVAPTARAFLVIARAQDVVRAQFFDVDDAVDKQLYHGVALSFVAADDGTRRVRRAMTVMDRTLVDDVVVEEGPGGAWVQRFIDGHNAGARFVARFEAEEGTATRVEIEAWAPPSGFSLGLGKLSPLGLEKNLKKMLAEHQKAIEGGYDPKARRSWASRALGGLADLTKPVTAMKPRQRKALVATLLEAAAVVAVADAHADEAERAVLDEVARALAKTELDAAARAKLVKSATTALEKQGMAARCAGIGARLKALKQGALGVSIATLVAEATHGIDPPELAALQKIAKAAGLPEAALRSILDRVDVEMESVRPVRRATPAPTRARAVPPPLPKKRA
jgi:tellurite resistance protein